MYEQMKVAYLSSEYPAISHTFIYREIQTLRRLGFIVITASINQPRNIKKMIKGELSEIEQTFYLKSTGYPKILHQHAITFFKTPVRYVRLFASSYKLLENSDISCWKKTMYFIEAVLLIRWMDNNKTQHIHVHFANPSASVAMIASSYGTFTFSMSVHGPDIFFNVEHNVLAEKIQRAVSVRCISDYCRSQVMRLVPHDEWKKFHIVRCGIDTELYQQRPEPENSTTEILCLGRLVPAKGQHILLEAAGLLIVQGIQFHITIVGDGVDHESLIQKVKDNKWENLITFTGAIGQDEVHNYYNNADIFVLPSFAEGLPVVLMESMAKGIATVSTYINGIPELIRDNENGRLVYASDSVSLAAVIEELISNESKRREIGKNGRKMVLKNYDIKKNCEQMANFFKKILEAEQ